MSKDELAPGPRGREMLRVIGAFRRDAAGALLTLAQQYGDVVQFHFGKRLNTLISHPDQVCQVLRDNAAAYGKGIAYDAYRPLIGDGLLTADGAAWQRQRKVAQTFFSAAKLQDFAAIVGAEAAALAVRWQKPAKAGDTVSMLREMNGLTFQAVARAMVSDDLEAVAETMFEALAVANREGTARIRAVLKLPPWLPTSANRRYRHAVAELDAIIARLVTARRASASPPGDYLGALLAATEGPDGLPGERVRDEILTFLFAGHETTSNALCWAFHLLLDHPDALERARAEIASVVGDRAPVFADIERLKFVQAILQEAMRLYPPIYAVQRRAMAEDRLGGWTIPAGTGVTVSPYVIHRHPDFWDDPGRFDPDRFLGTRAAGRNRFSYLPFGAGPRTCIGANFAMLEGTMVLATLLPRFSFGRGTAAATTAAPLISLSPSDGLPVRLGLFAA